MSYVCVVGYSIIGFFLVGCILSGIQTESDVAIGPFFAKTPSISLGASMYAVLQFVLTITA